MEIEAYKALVNTCTHNVMSALYQIADEHGMTESHKMMFISAVGDVLRYTCYIALAKVETCEDMDAVRAAIYDMHDRHVEDVVEYMTSIGVKMEVRKGERGTTEKPGQE